MLLTQVRPPAAPSRPVRICLRLPPQGPLPDLQPGYTMASVRDACEWSYLTEVEVESISSVSISSFPNIASHEVCQIRADELMDDQAETLM